MTASPAEMQPAYLLLEDGTVFDGFSCAADEIVTGEVVFTTGMAGYQEAVTDPSFAGQILIFTYPLIGNYGVSTDAMESDRIHARAVIMREAVDREDAPTAERGWVSWLTDCGVPALTGVDTRALVRHIRTKGSMRGGLFPQSVSRNDAHDRIVNEPQMAGQDLASQVTPQQVDLVGAPGGGPLIAAIDTGIKASIVKGLVEAGAQVRLHPLTDTPEQILAAGIGGTPDAVFLANGPGDPAAVEGVVETIRELLGKKPIWGICMGHQLLSRAVGLETYKLPFGHRGGNHPVKNLATGSVEITSQNHGFAVQTPDGTGKIMTDTPIEWSTDFGAAQLSHLNLYDRTVEGLILPEAGASTVQYHPEASPGPNDAKYLFAQFMQQIEKGI